MAISKLVAVDIVCMHDLLYIHLNSKYDAEMKNLSMNLQIERERDDRMD